MLPAERKRTSTVGDRARRLSCRVARTEVLEGDDSSSASFENHFRRSSHAGAVPTSSVGTERPYGQREVDHYAEKQAIAERAAQEVREGQVVCFDAGSTTMEVARAIPDTDYVAATNMPELAIELPRGGCRSQLSGGSLRPRPARSSARRPSAPSNGER